MQINTYHEVRSIPSKMPLYDSCCYEDIAIVKDYENLMQQINPNCHAIGRDGYFIAPRKVLSKNNFLIFFETGCYEISKDQFSVIHHNFLEENNLFCGKVKANDALQFAKDITCDGYNAVLLKTLRFLFSWLCKYAEVVKQHLSVREIASGKLINNDAVRMQLADIYILLEKCSYLFQVMMPKKSNYLNFCGKEIATLMLNTTAMLGKSAGGRAFLSRNIFELQALLCIFNDIYYKEAIM